MSENRRGWIFLLTLYIVNVMLKKFHKEMTSYKNNIIFATCVNFRRHRCQYNEN